MGRYQAVTLVSFFVFMGFVPGNQLHARCPDRAAVIRDSASAGIAEGVTADSLVIDKGDRTMCLYSGGAVVKRYAIALGFEPVGPKRRQGDGRTPEGRYTISGRNPESIYHLSLRISYPDAEDRHRARKVGLNPGGDIFIHGWPDSVAEKNASPPTGDWTRGCIAVTDAEIEELWRAVSVGTPVVILP
ncbi:hypothetical protein CHL67_00375 [Prosthecochloris sp. GSB1]|nr:hypothetical protein CHL67_00375 [Prosthecochloris sp. GSB1]